MKIVVFFLSLSFPLFLFANMNKGIQAAGLAAGGYYVGSMAVSAIEEEKHKTMCKSGKAWACGVAGLAAVSVIANGDSANKSLGLSDTLDCRTSGTCGGAGGGPGGANNPYNNQATGPMQDLSPYTQELLKEANSKWIPQAKETIEELKDKGYHADKNGVRLPNGKTVSSLSPEAFAAAGFGEEEQEIVKDVLKNMQKKHASLLAKLKESEEEYSGSASFDSGGGYAPETSSAARSMASMSMGSNQRNMQQPSVAGLSVNHGEDKIGVAAGNLFEMIHKAYKKNKSNLQP